MSEEDIPILEYRLDQLEKAVNRVDRKLDDYLVLKTQIATMGVLVDSLIKSRDKQIAAISAVAVGLLLVLLEMIFNLF